MGVCFNISPLCQIAEGQSQLLHTAQLPALLPPQPALYFPVSTQVTQGVHAESPFEGVYDGTPCADVVQVGHIVSPEEGPYVPARHGEH